MNKVQTKADKADIDILTDKLEKSLKLVNRDLKIKDKRIRDLEGGAQGSTNTRMNNSSSKG